MKYKIYRYDSMIMVPSYGYDLTGPILLGQSASTIDELLYKISKMRRKHRYVII